MASRTSVDDYLNEIGRYPLLTPEQEIALGRKVQRMMELRQLKEERPLTPTEKKQYEAGKRAAKDLLGLGVRLADALAAGPATVAELTATLGATDPTETLYLLARLRALGRARCVGGAVDGRWSSV